MSFFNSISLLLFVSTFTEIYLPNKIPPTFSYLYMTHSVYLVSHLSLGGMLFTGIKKTFRCLSLKIGTEENATFFSKNHLAVNSPSEKEKASWTPSSTMLMEGINNVQAAMLAMSCECNGCQDIIFAAHFPIF